MNSKTTPAPETILCRQCGLCCDGSLFADVVISKAELAPIEGIVGYEERSGRIFMQQPCLAYCDGDCQLYENRPGGCRQFECQLLKDVKFERTSSSEALNEIRSMKSRISGVKATLSELDQLDESLPLSFQYESALSEAWDLSESEERQQKREQLYVQVAELDSALQDRFRSDES